MAAASIFSQTLEYDPVYELRSPWQLLPPFDHPQEPARCLVTGTGLTHKASAENRQSMHAAAKAAVVTDSMRMYQWGLEGGRPTPGTIGTPPEWFYKGCGTILRAHGEPLDVPPRMRRPVSSAQVGSVWEIKSSWRVATKWKSG